MLQEMLDMLQERAGMMLEGCKIESFTLEVKDTELHMLTGVITFTLLVPISKISSVINKSIDAGINMTGVSLHPASELVGARVTAWMEIKE